MVIAAAMNSGKLTKNIPCKSSGISYRRANPLLLYIPKPCSHVPDIVVTLASMKVTLLMSTPFVLIRWRRDFHSWRSSVTDSLIWMLPWCGYRASR